MNNKIWKYFLIFFTIVIVLELGIYVSKILKCMKEYLGGLSKIIMKIFISQIDPPPK